MLACESQSTVTYKSRWIYMTIKRKKKTMQKKVLPLRRLEDLKRRRNDWKNKYIHLLFANIS